MECAARGRGTSCSGPATRRCGGCGAVAYCSISHQVLHWSDHKDECKRLEQQMRRADVLHDFPFTFAQEATLQICEKQQSRCSFLAKRGLHRVGMWKYECRCGASVASSDFFRMNDNWNLSSVLCPCHDPMHPVSKWLSNWEDYYEWRCIPLHSPVSLLLHWPLTVYHAIQLAASRNLIPGVCNKVHIHYLGPEKELLQIAVFSELLALFPGSEVHITFIGPEIPQFRDGEKINLCSYACCTDIDCMCKSSTENGSCGISDCGTAALTLQFYRGLYHERYGEIVKDSFPHLVVALNAGIAAYSSWSPTINLIKEMDVPAIFSDYCEEAAYLAVRCISTLTGHPLRLPIQLNPFRQPMAVEDGALFLPCYSNCYLFGF